MGVIVFLVDYESTIAVFILDVGMDGFFLISIEQVFCQGSIQLGCGLLFWNDSQQFLSVS
jgi:hypothetical protein